MSPNSVLETQSVKSDRNGSLTIEEKNIIITKHIGTDYSYRHEIVWKNAIGFLILHILAVWGLFIFFTGGINLKTYLLSKCPCHENVYVGYFGVKAESSLFFFFT